MYTLGIKYAEQCSARFHAQYSDRLNVSLRDGPSGRREEYYGAIISAVRMEDEVLF